MSLFADYRDWRWRPVPAGVLISILDSNGLPLASGTVGLILHKGGESLLISNKHLLVIDNLPRAISQPGLVPETAAQDIIGEVASFTPLEGFSNPLDMAWAKFTSPALAADKILGLKTGGLVPLESIIAEARIGDQVAKSGARSGVTFLQVIGTDGVIFLNSVQYIDVITLAGSAGAVSAALGDSGSALIGPGGTFLGLIFGSSTDGMMAYACKAKYVVEALGYGFQVARPSQTRASIPWPGERGGPTDPQAVPDSGQTDLGKSALAVGAAVGAGYASYKLVKVLTRKRSL